MLESIKLFLDVPSCAFVLAVDDDVVERGVVHHYRDYLSIYHHKDTQGTQGAMQHELPITGHEYLEKMIQLPIRLPVIDTVNVREFLKEHSSGWIKLIDEKGNPKNLRSSVFRNEILDTDEEFYISPVDKLLDFLSVAIPPKPRKIKRTAKLFETKLRLLDKSQLLEEVDYMFVAKLTLLDLFAPKLLRFIQNNGYGLIFNSLCYFRDAEYMAIQDENAFLRRSVEPREANQNSLMDKNIILEYIENKFCIDIEENGYTTKEQDTLKRVMRIVEEHYASRTVFDLDMIFNTSYDTEKLKLILELQKNKTEKVILKNIKQFSNEFNTRLFRGGDVDAWKDVLSEHNTMISPEQLQELIGKASDKKDKTFNNLPFIANPEWVGQIAKFVDEGDYIIFLKASHDARFKTIKDKTQIDMFQMTFAEYDKYCDIQGIEKPKDEGWGRGRRPVINVSWNDATKYVEWLSEFLDIKYALPNKDEWYLACNNGKDTKRHFGDDESQLREYAWYNENTESKSHPVGEKKPNTLGLYDMHGNVWEWCEDWYDEDKDTKVLRGGSWFDVSSDIKSAIHYWDSPTYSNFNVGFRLQRTLSL